MLLTWCCKDEEHKRKICIIFSIPKATNTNVTLAGTDDWLVANIKMKGFYRVNYDSDNWERLLTKLSTDHRVRDGRFGCVSKW